MRSVPCARHFILYIADEAVLGSRLMHYQWAVSALPPRHKRGGAR